MIFVFGSNLLGIHGAGAAAYAMKYYGAKWGVGEGLQGNSYALPTCSAPGTPLELPAVRLYVDRFLGFASDHMELQFQVTAVGTGIAGFSSREMSVLFFHRGTPENLWLPASFYRALYWEGYKQHSEDSNADSV